MPEHSAGILLWRLRASLPEVLLLHQGGPFWAKKDEAAWSIPKGAIEPGEDALAAARREFVEETGIPLPSGEPEPLGDFRYSSGKVVTVFALRGDLDPAALRPGTFTLEWPPKSGHMAEFPEADRAGWFGLSVASTKIVKGQRPVLDAFARRFGP
jgi:predicted NUDIX family NTP pyrophosphohydrolase